MTESTYTWDPAPFARWAKEHKHELRHFLRAAARHRARHGGPPFGRGGPWGPGRGFPFGAAGFGFGGGRRAGRGDIRIAILALLAEQPMHGYQIIQELERRSEGNWRPSPGSVYPTLQQLEDEGLVKTVEQEGGRRVFELTDAGREEAKGSAQSPPWDEVGGSVDDDLTPLRDLFFQTAAATWQVAQTGTSKQLGQAQEILREARRKLYQLLAEDSPPTG